MILNLNIRRSMGTKGITVLIALIGITFLLLNAFLINPSYDEEDLTYTTGVIVDTYEEHSRNYKSINTHVFFVLDNGMAFYHSRISDKDELDSFIGEEVTVGYVYRSEIFTFSMVNRTVSFASSGVVYQSSSDYNRKQIKDNIVVAVAIAVLCLLINLIDIIFFFGKRREEKLRAKKRAEKKKKKAELRKKYEQLNKDS